MAQGLAPEFMPPKTGNDSFLIIGAGPAGLECARMLGGRGYAVHVADAALELGRRVSRELPAAGPCGLGHASGTID